MTPAEPGARRVFEGARIWRLTDDQLWAAAALIAAAERAHAHDVIVGIARGGVAPAAALSDLTGVRQHIITARHNLTDQIETPATGHVTLDVADLPTDLHRARILVVDDICGTGATLRAATNAVQGLGAATIRTAVLCRNTGSLLYPDTWVWDVADWTVFPWEPDPGRPTQLLPEPAEVRHP
jgi:hypoxanthine phosphoribosyltransferase